jgi:uncharacterized SAM-binding protein YcdF (DUF218 family)
VESPDAAIAAAVVVLGCRVEATGQPSSALARRAARALEAFERGVASAIVVSGGRRWHGHLVEAECARNWLVARGVPESRIHAELLSLTTAENAVFSAELLRRIGARSTLVATCAWHMPRAIACFAAVGIDAIALPAPSPERSLVTRVRRALGEATSARLDRWALGRLASLRARGVPHPFDDRAEDASRR